jgi:hypothetical protein
MQLSCNTRVKDNRRYEARVRQAYEVRFCFTEIATSCNRSACSAALGAVTANFEPADDDVEPALALDLSLEPVEQIAFEFRNFSASKAGHVDVIALWAAFVEVLLALHMHEVEFVNQTVAFQEIQRAIHSHAIDAWIEPPRLAKNLRGIQMLLRGFNHAENGPSLVRHSQATGHQFGLQAPRNFSLRQRHELKPSCNSLSNYEEPSARGNTNCRPSS